MPNLLAFIWRCRRLLQVGSLALCGLTFLRPQLLFPTEKARMATSHTLTSAQGLLAKSSASRKCRRSSAVSEGPPRSLSCSALEELGMSSQASIMIVFTYM